MRAVLTSEFEWCREALVGDSGEKLGVQAIFSGGVINHWWEGIGKCELGFDSRSGQCDEHSGGKKAANSFSQKQNRRNKQKKGLARLEKKMLI